MVSVRKEAMSDEQNKVLLEALETAYKRVSSEDWIGTCGLCSKRMGLPCYCLEEHEEILEKIQNAIDLLKGVKNES